MVGKKVAQVRQVLQGGPVHLVALQLVVVQDEPVKIGEVGQRQRGQRGDVVALEIATEMLDVAADVEHQMEHFLFGFISGVHVVKRLKAWEMIG